MTDQGLAGVLAALCALGVVVAVTVATKRRRHMSDDDPRAGSMRKTPMTGQGFIGGGLVLLVAVPVLLARGHVGIAVLLGLLSVAVIGAAAVIIRRDL